MEHSFSSQRWTNQTFWRRSGIENNHQGFSFWESEGSLPPPPQDSWSDLWFLVHDRKLRLPPSRRTQSQSNLYSPREESFLIPVKYIDVSGTTHTNLDVKQERGIDDYWNIDVSRDLFFFFLERFHSVYSSRRETSRRIFVFRGDTDRTAGNIQARSFMARTLYEIWKKCQAEGEAKVVTWKTTTRLRGIYFIDPEDKEFKDIIKNARNKLETAVAPAMLCKTSKKNKHGETRCKTDDFKSKFACILEASESTRLRMEKSLPSYHEENALQHHNVVHNFITVPQAMKIRAAKAAVDQEWEKFEKDSGVGPDKKSEVNQIMLPHWWTLVIWTVPNWRQSTKNTMVELYFEETLWKMILDLMQYSLNKDHQHLKWRKQKSWISFPDCLVAMDKQRTQYLLIPRSKWKKHRRYWKFQNHNVQTFGFVYHDTNGLNHGPVWKSQSFALDRNLYGHPCAGLLWERQFEKIQLKYGWKKVSNCECFFRTPWKRVILICMWMT